MGTANELHDDCALPTTVHDNLSFADLPHPVHLNTAFGRPMEEALFGAEFWMALKPYLAADTLPTEWILNHAPTSSPDPQAPSQAP